MFKIMKQGGVNLQPAEDKRDFFSLINGFKNSRYITFVAVHGSNVPFCVF